MGIQHDFSSLKAAAPSGSATFKLRFQVEFWGQ
jgi:hypothetical protein